MVYTTRFSGVQTPMSWANSKKLKSRSYSCGHCDGNVASELGYTGKPSSMWFFEQLGRVVNGFIYICHLCDKPTFFVDVDGRVHSQIPAPKYGQPMEFFPDGIRELHEEVRQCVGSRSYTAAVMLCRKLLMHIAVEKGAAEGLKFKEYVDYLNDNHYLPPDSKVWVDHIREQGNEANHEVVLKTKDDAIALLEVITMLANFMYALPSRASRFVPKSSDDESS